jgi:hypothetical protein
VLEFLFYGGVMKAVEEMASPFGDDNQDFNLNFLVERHVKVYLTSDTSYDSLLCSLTQPNNTSNNLTLFFYHLNILNFNSNFGLKFSWEAQGDCAVER